MDVLSIQSEYIWLNECKDVKKSVAADLAAAAPRIEERELLELGFKVLVAKTDVQEKWVRNLPPGQIRPMQRTGKKYFIYPDAPNKQIYVGGPNEYEAYLQDQIDKGFVSDEPVTGNEFTTTQPGLGSGETEGGQE